MTRTESIDIDRIIAEIDDQGYSVLSGVISTHKADEARSALEPILAGEITPDERAARHQRVGAIAVKHPVFLELMCHPLILAVWKRYLGEDVVCSTWTSNTIYPGFDKIGWHADYPYWSITPPWPRGNLAGQSVWLLDDFTETNGGTGVLPYSHLKRKPPSDPKDVWREEGEIITGKRGTVVLGHGAWWHTARPNRSDKPRSCLLGMYCRPCVITQEDMRAQLDLLDNPDETVTQLMCGNIYKPRIIGAEKLKDTRP